MPIELDCTVTQEDADKMLECVHQPIVFHGHIIKKLNFSNRELTGVFFAGIWIEDTSFKNSQYLETSFYGSFLENVDFSGANLEKTIFKESKIYNCNFKGIKAPLWKRIYLWLKNT